MQRKLDIVEGQGVETMIRPEDCDHKSGEWLRVQGACDKCGTEQDTLDQHSLVDKTTCFLSQASACPDAVCRHQIGEHD